MAKIFCSRVKFTLLGAPIDAFYIDLIKSLDIRDMVDITPFVPLNTLPNAQSFTTFHESVRISLTYNVLDDSKTFDFKLLPYGLVNVQLLAYKEKELVGKGSGLWFSDQTFTASQAGEPATVTVKFDAINFLYNFVA